MQKNCHVGKVSSSHRLHKKNISQFFQTKTNKLMKMTTRGNPQSFCRLNRDDLELQELEKDGYPEDPVLTQQMKNEVVMELMDVEDGENLEVQEDLLPEDI